MYIHSLFRSAVRRYFLIPCDGVLFASLSPDDSDEPSIDAARGAMERVAVCVPFAGRARGNTSRLPGLAS